MNAYFSKTKQAGEMWNPCDLTTFTRWRVDNGKFGLPTPSMIMEFLETKAFIGSLKKQGKLVVLYDKDNQPTHIFQSPATLLEFLDYAKNSNLKRR